MRELYQPANAIEANLLLHVLQSEGVRVRLDGEYLQGAMGELPAAGLLRIMVEDEDYAHGREIVADWDKPLHPATPATRDPSPRWPALLLTLLIGVAIGWLLGKAG